MSSKLPQPVHDLLLSAHLLWDIGANSVYAWRIHRVLSVRFLPLGRSPAGKSLLSKNLLRSAITAVSVEVPSLLGRRRVALIFLNYLRVRNAFSEYDRVRHKAQSSFEELLCEVRRFNDHSELILSIFMTTTSTCRSLNNRNTYQVDVCISPSYITKLVSSKRILL
jgi:hypothetical protein